VNGYSRHKEVEEVLGALERLGGPGQVLRGVALNAAREFRRLDVGQEAHLGDVLCDGMVEVLRKWTRAMGGGQESPKPPEGRGQ